MAACGGEESSDAPTAPPPSPDADAAADAEATSNEGTRTISKNGTTLFESSPAIAVAPNGRIAVAWVGGTATGLRLGYTLASASGDFRAPAHIDSIRGRPSLASLEDSSFLLAYDRGNRTVVRKAGPEDASFGEGIDVSQLAKEIVTSSVSVARVGSGAVVVFAVRSGNENNEPPTNVDSIVAARTTDGTSFARSNVVEPQASGTFVQAPFVCGSRKTSRAWTIHADSRNVGSTTLRWSDDGGATWPNENVDVVREEERDGVTPQNYQLRCAGEGDELYVMYGYTTAPPSFAFMTLVPRIVIRHSSDGGKTFDRTTTIEESGVLFGSQEISVDSAGGRSRHRVSWTGGQ